MTATWELGGALVKPPRIRCRTSVAGSLALVDPVGESSDGRTLSGTFSVFDTWQEIHEVGLTFMEKISRSAFSKTIRESADKVRVLYSHGRDPAIGTQLLGKLLDLKEDSRGAQYSVQLFDGVPPLLLAGLKEGRYGSSFRARVIKERYEPRPGRSPHNPTGLPESVVTEVKLIDVGPTPFPAYPTTSAQVRSEVEAREVIENSHPLPSWFLEREPAWSLESLRRGEHAFTRAREDWARAHPRFSQ